MGTLQKHARLMNAVVFAAIVAASGATAAPVFKTIHTFQGGSDGAYPNGGMIGAVHPTSGAAFGMTSAGGSSDCPGGCGVVFRITPTITANGPEGYTYKVIYRFRGGGGGNVPVQPSELYTCGNFSLCGATRYGGNGGWGNIYRITDPRDGGQWTYEELYAFTGGSDGYYPTGPLPRFYGVTRKGGDNGEGTLFRLIDNAGTFTLDIIHHFGATANDGKQPLAVAIGPNNKGNIFYVVTEKGGNQDRGAIVQFDNDNADVLSSFKGTGADAPHPSRGLLQSTWRGSGPPPPFFGLTERGGPTNDGTIYIGGEFDAPSKLTTLFAFNGKNGSAPQGIPAVIGADKVFGMTNRGGKYNNGTVFLYSRQDGTFETLHDFRGADFPDGGRPVGGVGADSPHSVVGSTSVGGAKCNGEGEPSCGTVFLIER